VNPRDDKNVPDDGTRRGVVTAAAASLSAPGLIPTFASAKTGRVEARPVEVLELSDENLFEKARGGDHNALGSLISRYEKTLFNLLLRMTNGDRHKSDDLFQETFLHAMRAAQTFNRKLAFKPWVTAIAVNLVRDDARKRKVRGEVALDNSNGDSEHARSAEPVAQDEGPSARAERHDEENSVRRALQKLTDLEREVVLLHFYNGMTLVETSEILGVPLGTVKSRLHAALTRLSGMLEKRED
jgi:RNA polymerase sigma-70 factor, ECF subfamily